MKIPIGMRKFYLSIFFGLLFGVIIITLALLKVPLDSYMIGSIGGGLGLIMADSVYGYSKEYKHGNSMFGKSETVTEKENKITK